MSNKRIIVLVIILILITMGFSQINNNNDQVERIVVVDSFPEIDLNCDSLLEKWKEDSCGCLNFRRPRIMYAIIEEMAIQEIKIDSFVSVFGNANQVFKINDKQCLVYYFNSVCNGNEFLKLPEGYCQIEVVFSDNNPKYEISAICF